MTLQEIKDQVALEYGCDDWQYLENYFADGQFPYLIIDVVARRYAKAAIEEDRKDAAEKATCTIIGSCDDFWVDKSSIIDRPLPDLK